MPVHRHEFVARDKREGLSYKELCAIFTTGAYPEDGTVVRVEQGMKNQIKKLTIEVRDGGE